MRQEKTKELFQIKETKEHATIAMHSPKLEPRPKEDIKS